jgi:hypothetical protein
MRYKKTYKEYKQIEKKNLVNQIKFNFLFFGIWIILILACLLDKSIK